MRATIVRPQPIDPSTPFPATIEEALTGTPQPKVIGQEPTNPIIWGDSTPLVQETEAIQPGPMIHAGDVIENILIGHDATFQSGNLIRWQLITGANRTVSTTSPDLTTILIPTYETPGEANRGLPIPGASTPINLYPRFRIAYGPTYLFLRIDNGSAAGVVFQWVITIRTARP